MGSGWEKNYLRVFRVRRQYLVDGSEVNTAAACGSFKSFLLKPRESPPRAKRAGRGETGSSRQDLKESTRRRDAGLWHLERVWLKLDLLTICLPSHRQSGGVRLVGL